MSNKAPDADDRPTEDEIRDYAHHLYVSSGWLPGRDLDNWLAAEAHLIAERKVRQPAPRRRSRPDVPASPPNVDATMTLTCSP